MPWEWYKKFCDFNHFGSFPGSINLCCLFCSPNIHLSACPSLSWSWILSLWNSKHTSAKQSHSGQSAIRLWRSGRATYIEKIMEENITAEGSWWRRRRPSLPSSFSRKRLSFLQVIFNILNIGWVKRPPFISIIFTPEKNLWIWHFHF